MIRVNARSWRVSVTAVGVIALSTYAACSQTPVVLPSRDLDRPTDMTFSCIGRLTSDPAAVGGRRRVSKISGQPMGKCHPSNLPDPKPDAVDADGWDYRTFSFVTNADRGDLSVVDMSYCRPDDTACHPPGAVLVDLDPDSVGYRAAPLGVLPEVIAASQDGCRLVTANRGSCDLTLVDPTALLTRHLDPLGDLASLPPIDGSVVTIVPLTASGRLQVAPGEIAFVPQQTALLGDPVHVCDSTSSPGTLAPPVGDPAPAPDERVPWRAVVTFPSCDLVALVDLPSGMILDSYQVTGDASAPSLQHTGTSPTCPSTDCPYVPAVGIDAGADDAAGTQEDGGTSGSAGLDGGGSVAAPASGRLGISALAMHPEGKRIYFGGVNTPSVFSLDIEGKTLVAPAYSPPPPKEIPTLDRAEGVLRLRLSVDAYAYSKGHDALTEGRVALMAATDSGDADAQAAAEASIAAAASRPEYGRFVAGRHDNQPSDPLEFLYVIAKDGSLRVMDVGRPEGAPDAPPVECDLGIDPGDPNAQASDGTRRACFQYPAPTNPVPKDWPRRLLSAGIPGLRLSSPPQDVAFANYLTPGTNTPATPTVDEQLMNGAFAFVMTNAGAVYVLNIDPEPRNTHQAWKDPMGVIHRDATSTDTNLPESPTPLTHSQRDFNVLTYATSLGAQIGPPRIDTAPIAPVEGPSLKGFQTGESRIDARAITFTGTSDPLTYAYFPNRATVHPQTWRIEWEGDISGVRVTGQIADNSGGATADAPLPTVTTITDSGSGFCPLGGGDGDILTLVGCDTDAGCPVGSACIHSTEAPATVDGRAIQGMCLPRSRTTDQVTNETRQACESMMQTFRRYEIMTATDGSTTVVPRRAEVPRPAYTNDQGQRVTCDKDSDCSQAGPAFMDFTCATLSLRLDATTLRDRAVMADGTVREGDLRSRCLQSCGGPKDHPCRAGRVCVSYPDGGSFCAEGAPIDKSCGLDQLVSYKLSAGGAFVVTGSVSGRTESFRTRSTPTGPVCDRDPSVPDLVARIPMNSPRCGDDATPTIDADGRFLWDDNFLGKAAGLRYPISGPCFVCEHNDDKTKVLTAVTTPSCPVDSTHPSVVSAVFQNTELRFVLTNVEEQLADPLLIQFNVDGGFAAQSVFTSSDALPGLPGRILLGPVSSADQTMLACPLDTTSPCSNPDSFYDLPYLFVVDQRSYINGRLGPRGQILRITPRISATAPYAGFEGFAASGKYFPIQ